MKQSTKQALLKRAAYTLEMLGICCLLLSLFKSYVALGVGTASLILSFALTYASEEF